IPLRLTLRVRPQKCSAAGRGVPTTRPWTGIRVSILRGTASSLAIQLSSTPRSSGRRKAALAPASIAAASTPGGSAAGTRTRTETRRGGYDASEPAATWAKSDSQRAADSFRRERRGGERECARGVLSLGRYPPEHDE